MNDTQEFALFDVTDAERDQAHDRQCVEGCA